MNERLTQQVRNRAGARCEYCQMPERYYRSSFACDHIVARQHGGATVADNLAFACLHCNSHKGPNLSGIDPLTGRVVRLFHPRKQVWSQHFRWRNERMIVRTPNGRATVDVLALNEPDLAFARLMLIAEGVFPPS